MLIGEDVVEFESRSMKKAVFLIFALLAFAAVVHVHAEDAAETEAVEEVAADSFSPEQRDAISKSEEKFEFQAEVGRLMDILIKYLYSNKEVFLRELISNGSDALDKLRFMSLTDATQIGDFDKFEIRISADKEKRLLTIRDTGIGMTREELIKNLGTVAKSGTTQFVDAMASGAAEGKDPLSLIGQFGVGFYSVYLVADWVTVASKSNGSDKQYLWESAAQGTFTIAADPRGNSLTRGTEVVLRLKEDAKEFADFATLKRIVTKYSEFINFPIYIEEVKTVEKEVPVEEDESTEEKKEGDEEKKEGDDVEVKEEKDEKPKTKKVKEEERSWIQVNEQKPIWTRNPKEVTDEEYNNFYKSMTKDTEDPLTHIHFVAEGDVSFRALLYIPKKAPAGLYDNYYSKSSSIKLFVRRVLIAEEFDELMPRYLSFVKGVVESDDLPLNVNRETLQKNKLLQVIGKKLVQKSLFMINQMVEDDAEITDSAAEKSYETFWKQFGKSIRLGLIEDHSKNGKKLSKLLRFPSAKHDTPVALQTYVDEMKKSQDTIYYIAGESVAVVKESPFLEKLTKKGMDVLFMVDPLDEHAVQQVTEFDGKKLQSITKEGISLGKSSDKAKQKLDEAQDSFKPLCEFLQNLYGSSKVEKVTVSDRAVSSPAILSTAQYGWSANMERIMRAQALNDASRSSHMIAKRTLELNFKHPIVKELKARVAADADDDKIKDLARLLYDAAALNSGFAVDDSKDFGDRVYRVIASGMGLSPDAKADDADDDAEEAPEAEEAEDAAEEAEEVAEKPAHDEL